VVCDLRDFEDKILLHQFLKSESTKGLSIYVCMVNSDKQEQLWTMRDLKIKLKFKVIKVNIHKK